MSKIKFTLYSILIGISILFTACDNSDSVSENSERGGASNTAAAEESAVAELSLIRADFDKDCDYLRTSEGTLKFSEHTVFSSPEFEKICTLSLAPLTGKTVDELYSWFCGNVDVLMSNSLSDEYKHDNIEFYGGEPNAVNIDEYKNSIQAEIPFFGIDTEDCFIDNLSGVMRCFDNGAMCDHDGVERKITLMGNGAMFVDPAHKVVEYTSDLTRKDALHLPNGDVPIADAARFAQNFLDTLDCSPYDCAIPKPRVIGVSIVDIGNGEFGFEFATAVEYGGVLFNYNGEYGGKVGVENDYDKREYIHIDGTLDMIATDKVHRFMGTYWGVEIAEGDSQTTAITLKRAVNILNDFFSSAGDYSVREVSAVWLPEVTENGELAYPCWKFVLVSNGEFYHTFVDMITGEVRLYIRVNV